MTWEIKWTHPWPVRCVDGSGGGGQWGGGGGGGGEDDVVVEEEKGKEKDVGRVVMDHVERSLIIELKSIQRERCHVSCVMCHLEDSKSALHERSNHDTHFSFFMCVAGVISKAQLYYIQKFIIKYQISFPNNLIKTPLVIKKYFTKSTMQTNQQEEEKVCLDNLPKLSSKFTRMTCCGKGLHIKCYDNIFKSSMSQNQKKCYVQRGTVQRRS